MNRRSWWHRPLFSPFELAAEIFLTAALAFIVARMIP